MAGLDPAAQIREDARAAWRAGMAAARAAAAASERQSVAPDDGRRAAIQALVTGGSTEGERSAAQAALERHDAAAGAHMATMNRLDSEASSFGSYE